MSTFDLKILEPGHDEQFKLISPNIILCLMLMFSLGRVDNNFYSLQINFHELKTYNYRFNGDSSSVVVSDTSFSVDQLQPINNYSIDVAALRNNTTVRNKLMKISNMVMEIRNNKHLK